MTLNVLARDIMQKDVKTVSSGDSMAELERRFIADDVGGFPVVDGGAICGVVSSSDVIAQLCAERMGVALETAFYDESTDPDHIPDDWLAAEVGKRAEHLCVADVMNRQVISVEPETTISEVAKLMTQQKIHRVLVVAADQLVGVISSLDIVRACANELIDISYRSPKILDF